MQQTGRTNKVKEDHALKISFAGEAEEAFRSLVDRIPVGWTIALLAEGQELPHGDIVDGVDVAFMGVSEEGIVFQPIDENGERVDGLQVRPWLEVDRVHIY